MVNWSGASASREYQRLAEVFGLNEDDLRLLTLNAVRSTFLPVGERRKMEAEFGEQFERLNSSLS